MNSRCALRFIACPVSVNQSPVLSAVYFTRYPIPHKPLRNRRSRTISLNVYLKPARITIISVNSRKQRRVDWIGLVAILSGHMAPIYGFNRLQTCFLFFNIIFRSRSSLLCVAVGTAEAFKTRNLLHCRCVSFSNHHFSNSQYRWRR